MRPSSLLGACIPLVVNAINVVQTNDDGWAMVNIRVLYKSLTDAGFSSIISAPADNQSGKGSREKEPVEVSHKGCHFGSCPPYSPPYGKNATEPRFNYVNSYPVTAIRYGIQNLSETFFDGPPDITVSGPNAGNNLGWTTTLSGTVCAAVEAAKLGVPAIAFSGPGHHVPWSAPVRPDMQVYADLSTMVTRVLTNGSKPFLPEDAILNVNFPRFHDKCESISDVKFILTRVFPRISRGFLSHPDDVDLCGSTHLPDEWSVVHGGGCFASVSVIGSDKKDVDAEKQKFVAQKLESILMCLPDKRRKRL